MNGEGQLLLTVPEAASRLSIGRTLVYGLLLRGELRSLKLGRARRIPVEALQQYLDKLAQQQSDL